MDLVDIRDSSSVPSIHFFLNKQVPASNILIRDRTMAGLQAACARGQSGGRTQALTPDQVKMTSELMKNKKVTIKEICKTLRVSRTTLYRYVNPHGEVRKAGKSTVLTHVQL